MSKTILITGGTSGLGLAATKYIAENARDSRIIVASRTLPSNTPLPKTAQFIPLDLSSLASVRTFVDDWTAGPISALVLNAGLQFTKLTYTGDGIESTFGINHVGHALLFHLFASRGLLQDSCRIVITSSGTHDPAKKTGMPDALYVSAEECARPADKEFLGNGQRRYATSKLCNVLWMYALSRRVKQAGKGWTVTAMDPGLMPGTGLAREYSWFLKFVWGNILPFLIPLLQFVEPNTHTTAESGAALGKLAIDNKFAGVTGKYFEGAMQINSSVVSNEIEKQEELWEWTIKHIAAGPKEVDDFERL